MLRKTLLPLLFGAAVLAGPALAEEVLYFTNGTSMPIVSHTVEEEMIQVVLGGGAFMAFPIDQIERIETANGQISLLDGSGNRMVPSTGSQYRTQGVVPSRHRNGKWGGGVSREMTRRRDPGTEVEPDEHGVATIRPFAASHNSAKAEMRVAGRASMYSQPISEDRADGPIGTQKVGNRYVLPGNTPASARRVQPVGLTARDSGSAPPPASGDSGDSGSSGKTD